MLKIGGDVDESLGAGVRPDGLRVVLLALDAGPGDDFDRWVVNDIGDAIEHLRSELAPGDETTQDRRPLAIAVVSGPATSPWQEAAMEAAWQAVRGVVQALTRELGAREATLNAVRATETTLPELSETLAFLASKRGGFVAGASIDLRPIQ